MTYLDPNSLFKTIDNVSEALLFGVEINEDEKNQIVDFIVSRQGKPLAYAEMFAPTDDDMKDNLILFTGEKITSRVGKRHMIGEEASRLLHKLGVKTKQVKQALQKSDTSLLNMVNSLLNDPKYNYEYGMYCCKSCSCGLWLNLGSGGLGNDTNMLKAGINYLKRHRDNTGKWKGFPYYYTLYVLNNMDDDIAKEEMAYTAQAIERRLGKNRPMKTKYDIRRNYILEQIMTKICV